MIALNESGDYREKAEFAITGGGGYAQIWSVNDDKKNIVISKTSL